MHVPVQGWGIWRMGGVVGAKRRNKRAQDQGVQSGENIPL